MPDTKTRKPRFSPSLRIGGAGLDAEALGQMAGKHPEQFMARCQDMVTSGELRWENIRSLPRMFWALADIKVPAVMNVMGQERAIMSSAFPLLAGAMTIAGMQEAWDALPTIGQDLVTERETNKRVSEFARLTGQDVQVDTVKEGDDFPEIGAGEERVEIRSKRNGRRLSITAETIEENNVTDLVDRINRLAEIANEIIEEQTLRRVCDIDGSGSSPAEPYAFHPEGTGTQLYNATANNPGTRAPSGTRIENNALVDETDLEAARTVLAAMKNDLGKRIWIPMSQCTLLVPDALLGTAQKITNSILVPGTVNEHNVWGPSGQHRPTLLSSPKMDDLSTTTWYLGWFKKQFQRVWKLRFEYMTLGMDTESFLKSRLAFQARIAWDCEVGALGYEHVVQSLSSTTAP